LAVHDRFHSFAELRLSALLGELGFEKRIEVVVKDTIKATRELMFVRKKLCQCEQPFVINIESVEQFEATCEDPFQVGANVLAHSLGKAALNGAEGRVVGHQGDRVVVMFQPPTGEKALKRNNLMPTTTCYSATAVNAASVQVMDGEASGDLGPLVNDGQSSMDRASDNARTSAALLADNQ